MLPTGEELWRLGSEAAMARQAQVLPPDQSFRLRVPDQITQDWIDGVVLRALETSPLWSDYVVVQERPTVWELASLTESMNESEISLISDDCFVFAAKESIDSIVTINKITTYNSIYYMIAINILEFNYWRLIHLAPFRSLIGLYTIKYYEDCDLIDRFKISMGSGDFDAYLNHPERRRPIFIGRKTAAMAKTPREDQRLMATFLASYGAVIINDQLHYRYKQTLTQPSNDIIGVAPDGTAIALDCRRVGNSPWFFEPFRALLAATPLLKPPSLNADRPPLGRFALAAWPAGPRCRDRLDEIRSDGRACEARWHTLISKSSSALLADADAPAGRQPDLPAPCVATEIGLSRAIALDTEGYPLQASGIAIWAAQRLTGLELLPRARRELSRSSHPDPRRIAKALEALNGPKLTGYRGANGTVAAFESALIELRMHDGFSNAEYLRGQTGEAYIVTYQGRRLLLERHLCSNASGFNDPRLIRIYYVYDRPTGKIIVGWMPSHLPTSYS